MVAGLAKLLPETHWKPDGDSLVGVVRVDDAWFSVRWRAMPFAEIFVTTRPLGGFTFRLREGRVLATNDDALVDRWLDDVSRRAIDGSHWTFEQTADDRLVATKGRYEAEPKAMLAAMTTACTIAARSHRWAAEYVQLARELGASARSHLEIGGAPIIVAERHAMELEVALVRDRRLHTVVRTRRVGSEPTRVDEFAKKLLDVARPDDTRIDADRVELWFDGAMTTRERIDAALEMCARWAVDTPVASGPYR